MDINDNRDWNTFLLIVLNDLYAYFKKGTDNNMTRKSGLCNGVGEIYSLHSEYFLNYGYQDSDDSMLPLWKVWFVFAKMYSCFRPYTTPWTEHRPFKSA